MKSRSKCKEIKYFQQNDWQMQLVQKLKVKVKLKIKSRSKRKKTEYFQQTGWDLLLVHAVFPMKGEVFIKEGTADQQG